MITWGKGKHKVWIKNYNIGKDFVYFLGGGEKSHIGGVVICESNKDINVIRFENHYDYIVLKLIAEIICKKYNNKIIVIGGIHIDNASKEDIDKIIENCRRLAECI
jgi:gallate decarboxylase subunit D